MNTRKKNKNISANKKKSIKQQDGGAASSASAATATLVPALGPLHRAQVVLDTTEANADLDDLTTALNQDTLNVKELLQTVEGRLNKVDREYPLTQADIDYFNAALTGYENRFITRLESDYNKTSTENSDKKKELLRVLNSLLFTWLTLTNDDKVNTESQTDDRRKLIVLCVTIIDTIMEHIKTEKIDLKYQWIKITTAEKKNYINKVGIIKELVKVNPKYAVTTDRHKKGSWYFEVWVPNIRWRNDWTGENGEVVKIVDGNKETTLSVLYDNKPVDTFITTNVYIYAIEFLQDKYELYKTTNYKPNVENEGKHRFHKYIRSDRLAKIAASPVTEPARLVSYMMSPRAIKGRFKVEINKILDKMEDDPNVREDFDFKDILKRKIRYGNDLQTIKDILINKIASIFTDGESRFNPYNYFTGKMESKFAEDKAEKYDRDTVKGTAATEAVLAAGNLIQAATGAASGGARETNIQQQGGIGSYGNRNVDFTEAKQFIIFILRSLIEIEKLSSNEDSDNVDLLLKTYLKTLFAKIGPSGLNKLLPNIDSITKLSEQVIKHFKKNIDKDVDESTQIKKEAGEAEKTEEAEGRGKTEVSPDDNDPAKVIARLNFNLKHNVKSLITAIIDITLHYEDVKGSASVISNYLDNKYNMAMKKQSAEETRRIENNELKQALKYIFGVDSDKLDKYRTQINELDKVIDTMDANNIDAVIKEMMDKLNTNGELHVVADGATIVYSLPPALKVKLTERVDIEEAETATHQTNTDLIDTIKSTISTFEEDSFDYEKIKELKKTLGIKVEDELKKEQKIAKAREVLRKLEEDSKLELAYAEEDAARMKAELERKTRMVGFEDSFKESSDTIADPNKLRARVTELQELRSTTGHNPLTPIRSRSRAQDST